MKEEDIKDCVALRRERKKGRRKKGRFSATTGNGMGGGTALVSKFGNKCVWLWGCGGSGCGDGID